MAPPYLIMRIFVSGASGYLGSKLAQSLSAEHEVFALIRSTSNRTRLKGLDEQNLIFIDEPEVLESSFKSHKPDVVINTAALYGRKGETLDELVDANVMFPCRLLSLSQKYEVTAFVNTGSSLPAEVSPYALTKNFFVKLAGMSTVTSPKFINLALEHFYGPGDDSSKFTSHVIRSCLAGKVLDLTEGLQQRDFIYIEDVISAYKVVLNNLNSLIDNETICVGSGTAPSVRSFVEKVAETVGSDSELRFGKVQTRDNELMYSCADTSRLSALGWDCNYTLEQGIVETINAESK